MRLIHARECSHRSGKPFTVAAGDAAVLGAVEDIVGDRPSARVLRQQGVDQRAAFAAGLAHARKDMLLLAQLPVIEFPDSAEHTIERTYWWERGVPSV